MSKKKIKLKIFPFFFIVPVTHDGLFPTNKNSVPDQTSVSSEFFWIRCCPMLLSPVLARIRLSHFRENPTTLNMSKFFAPPSLSNQVTLSSFPSTDLLILSIGYKSPTLLTVFRIALHSILKLVYSTAGAQIKSVLLFLTSV